jgi:hypothetical protein
MLPGSGCVQRLKAQQGNQGRNDDGQPVEDEGRYLIAKGLSAPRGHHHQSIFFIKDIANDLSLKRSEIIESKDSFKNVPGLRDHHFHFLNGE